MQSLRGRTVVVAGATGDIGPFVVRALLERGATVAAPSRSEEKLGELREYLGGNGLDRLHTFTGSVSDERDAAGLRGRITERLGSPHAVVASVGDFVTTPSLLGASADDLQRALDGYLLTHFALARTFLPALKDSGGTYLMLQGPLAFELHPEFDAHLVSIATAGQHTLFRALAQELDDTPAHIAELVMYTLIRDRQTLPGAPVSGEEIGAFAADLLARADAGVHGQSIHLRSPDQVAAATA